jgi:hypothetical protein
MGADAKMKNAETNLDGKNQSKKIEKCFTNP